MEQIEQTQSIMLWIVSCRTLWLTHVSNYLFLQKKIQKNCLIQLKVDEYWKRWHWHQFLQLSRETLWFARCSHCICMALESFLHMTCFCFCHCDSKSFPQIDRAFKTKKMSTSVFLRTVFNNLMQSFMSVFRGILSKWPFCMKNQNDT